MMLQTTYITQELMTLLGGVAKSTITRRAKNEAWKFRPHAGRGGGNEWLVASMPKATRAALVAGLAAAEAPAQPLAVVESFVPALTAGGNITKKQLDTAEARLVFVKEIERLASVAGKEKAVMAIEKASREGTLAPRLQMLVPVANDKFGGGGKRGLSRRRLYAWSSIFAKEGFTGLIPQKSGKELSIPSWFPLFLAYYQKPQKPSLALAHADFCRDYASQLGENLPSYYAVKRMVAKMAVPEVEAGRKTGNALLKLRPHKLRKTGMLLPGDVYTGDGTTFDAEIAHPENGAPFKPEVTGIIDVATRLCVGMSLNMSENAFAVLDALRMACLLGGIPAMFYADNGPGYRNAILETPALGMFARLGIEATYAIPGRPQGKGLMERGIKTLCERAAKRLPTCTHADMDPDSAKKVFKLTRAQIKQFGKSSLLPTFEEFKKILLARVDEYNNTPHRALAKIVDSATGKRRHMTPAEAWNSYISQGWEPVRVPEGMETELFMPSEKRKVRNGMVEFHTGKYYAEELAPLHGDYVEVRYDHWNASYVHIYTLDGVHVCKASLDGNAIDYFPQSRIEAARANREAAQIKRLEAKAQRIAPGAQIMLHEPKEAFTVANIFNAASRAEPETLPVERLQTVEIPQAQAASVRPLFLSSQEKFEWLQRNPTEHTAKDREWLYVYANGEEYANLVEFYAFRGLAYANEPTAIHA